MRHFGSHSRPNGAASSGITTVYGSAASGDVTPLRSTSTARRALVPASMTRMASAGTGQPILGIHDELQGLPSTESLDLVGHDLRVALNCLCRGAGNVRRHQQ